MYRLVVLVISNFGSVFPQNLAGSVRSGTRGRGGNWTNWLKITCTKVRVVFITYRQFSMDSKYKNLKINSSFFGSLVDLVEGERMG